jgi:uncharacterized protein (UPF0248 family)
MHPLKNILNRLRWDDQERPENYLITYRHRGAPDDTKEILASRIVKLGKSYFTIQEPAASDETVIPFHRILEIRNTANDSVIWVGRKKEQNRGR